MDLLAHNEVVETVLGVARNKTSAKIEPAECTRFESPTSHCDAPEHAMHARLRYQTACACILDDLIDERLRFSSCARESTMSLYLNDTLMTYHVTSASLTLNEEGRERD